MIAVRKLVLAGAAAICRKICVRPSLQTIAFNAIRVDRPEIHDLIVDDDIRFVSYCLSRRDRSKSQIMQDLWVCFELGEKKGGYFVEFGATNGLKNSNTWLLEKHLEWKGILAEPNPIWIDDLSANRSAFIEDKCVSSKSGDVVSFITTNDSDPELSAIASFSQTDHFAETRQRGQRIQKETISLDDLLEKYQAPREIDYISIDTEGNELDILSAYSFRHQFKTISVECNPKTDNQIQKLLEREGYKRVFKHLSQWDAWYVAAGLRDRARKSITAPTA